MVAHVAAVAPPEPAEDAPAEAPSSSGVEKESAKEAVATAAEGTS